MQFNFGTDSKVVSFVVSDRAAEMRFRDRLLIVFLVPSTSVFRVGITVVTCNLVTMIESSRLGRSLSWRRLCTSCCGNSSILFECLHLIIGEFIKRSLCLRGLSATHMKGGALKGSAGGVVEQLAIRLHRLASCSSLLI